MSALSAQSKIRASIGAISQWWREWRDSSSELKYCGEDAIEGMAKDAGVSVDEFRQLARKSPHSADLLLRRMTALDLDPGEVHRIEPQTFHDLQRVCSMCREQRRCVHDLAADADNPAWKDYCPNVATLMALNALPWASRREW